MAVSTQNQAFNALLFVYQEVLHVTKNAQANVIYFGFSNWDMDFRQKATKLTKKAPPITEEHELFFDMINRITGIDLRLPKAPWRKE